MSESDFVHAVHTVTGIVSKIPRSYLNSQPFRELSDEEVIELRRKTELEMFGEYKTPTPNAQAVAVAEAPTEALEAPTEEGGISND